VAQSQADDGGFALIDRRYLLVIPIPCYVDDAGAVWIERPWRQDLLEHLTYLKDFVLCAPRVRRGSQPDLVPLSLPPGARMSVAFLPPQTSLVRALLNAPRTASALWRAIGQAEIVHSGVGGSPYPLGWIANPLALLRGRRLVIVVESDWRCGGAGRRSWKQRVKDMDPIRHLMARWSCDRAHLAIFTQPSYRAALRSRAPESAYVAPAVWVNEADILDDQAAEAAWAAKSRGPVRLLFAGRMLVSKGLDVLLASLRSLEAMGAAVQVDVIGEGERREACVKASAELRSVRLSVLDPVPYGKPFFELLRRYHALLVPSLSTEQPRILFDASAQAVPSIASDTDGVRPHVQHGATGWLVPPGDAAALASAIARASSASPELRSMGLAALRASRGATHKAMHRNRSQLIRKHCT
jgi:glycosyltransferase involved in cell wall biosynthesis